MTREEYNKEIDFIFNRFPSFQQAGGKAYKPGIETMRQLDALTGHPHRRFRSVHVAGTNGKGSVSHMLAAALMEMPPAAAHRLRTACPVAAEDSGSGRSSRIFPEEGELRSPFPAGAHRNGVGNGDGPLTVGLYTSPHLTDFRERIRVNGALIEERFVYEFLLRHKADFLRLGASFFEITTALAFAYFAHRGVDFAVVECGLGGRLDSTNIITPVLSVITNIGLDHCEYLGHTREEIAREKAGIIKPGIPVIIGETDDDEADAAVAADSPEGIAPGCGLPLGERGGCGAGRKNDSDRSVSHNGKERPDAVREVFLERCRQVQAPVYFASELAETASRIWGAQNGSEPRPVGEEGNSRTEIRPAGAGADAAAAGVAERCGEHPEPGNGKPCGISGQRIYDRARNLLVRMVPGQMDLQGACQERNIRTVSLAYAVLVQAVLSAPDTVPASDDAAADGKRSGPGGTGKEKPAGEECRPYGPAGERIPGAEPPRQPAVPEPDLLAAAAAGFSRAAALTGLRGRWETVCSRPAVICDTGHNAHGFRLLGPQIAERARKHGRLFLIFGVVADKDLKAIVKFLPREYVNCRGERRQARYYFANASGSRALPARDLAEKLTEYGFCGQAVPPAPEEGPEAGSVGKALDLCLKECDPEDFVFVGGSTFVVAEALSFFEKKKAVDDYFLEKQKK